MYHVFKLKIDSHVHKHRLRWEQMRRIPFNWSLLIIQVCLHCILSCHCQPSLLPKNHWIWPIKKPLLMWNIAPPLKSAEQVKINQKEVKCSNNEETMSQSIVKRIQWSKTKIRFENIAALVSFSVWFYTDKKHSLFTSLDQLYSLCISVIKLINRTCPLPWKVTLHPSRIGLNGKKPRLLLLEMCNQKLKNILLSNSINMD